MIFPDQCMYFLLLYIFITSLEYGNPMGNRRKCNYPSRGFMSYGNTVRPMMMEVLEWVISITSRVKEILHTKFTPSRDHTRDLHAGSSQVESRLKQVQNKKSFFEMFLIQQNFVTLSSFRLSVHVKNLTDATVGWIGRRRISILITNRIVKSHKSRNA